MNNFRSARPPLTKLAPPTSQSRLLVRPGILASVCALADRKLVVITAPTGSGKSTLLAQAHLSLAASGVDVAWLSVDEGDNSPLRFVAHLIASLQRARPQTGIDAQALMTSPVAIEDVMASLINDLTISERPLVLFLDDYQTIDVPEIHAAVSYLLQYSPAGVQLAIASQKTPPLGIARLKARGAVIELGFDDLRLSSDEIRAYLAQATRAPLDDEIVRLLALQTEGWICGLQLAMLALDRRAALPVVAVRAAGFADALLEEVLAAQSGPVREFLLRTSVLAQFSAPLAEAVTGRPDAQGMIALLEDANLFVVRLDGEREWFRYHHLFSGFLRKRLQTTDAGLAADLNRRAARWCHGNGQPAEAMRYALAADDKALAASLLETWGRELMRDGSFKELAEWLEALPASAVRASAVLCVQDGWTQLYLGDPVAAGAAIRAGEALLAPGEGARGLRDELQILRTMSGITRYDLPDVSGLRDDLPEAFGPEEPMQRAYAHVVLGYAARLAGRLDDARARYEEAMRISERHEDTVVNLMARYNIAMVHYLQARPILAAEGLTHWMRDARNKRWQRAGSAAFLKAAHALMLLETGNPGDALTESNEAIDLLSATRTYAYVGIALSQRALIQAAHGNFAAAQEDLARARRIGREQTLERVLFRASLAAARIACRQQQVADARRALDEALAILQQTGQTAMRLPSENHAAYQGVLAEALLVEGRPVEAAAISEAGLGNARAAGRTRFEIEFLLWSALAMTALGQADEAAAPVARAVDLAAGSNVIYPFSLGGAALLQLLAPHRAGGVRTAFAARIAAGLEHTLATPGVRKAPALHQREVQILQLLGQGLRNREIGARLFVSEDTVKWYLKKIYETLKVGNRTHALVRARELGMIG